MLTFTRDGSDRLPVPLEQRSHPVDPQLPVPSQDMCLHVHLPPMGEGKIKGAGVRGEGWGLIVRGGGPTVLCPLRSREGGKFHVVLLQTQSVPA